MATGIVRDCILRIKWSPTVLIQRFRRVNVQRPRAPHYERARVLALLTPQYKEDPTKYLPSSLKCRKQDELEQKVLQLENPLEKILAKELFNYFEKSQLVGFLHKNIISGEDEFQSKIKLNLMNIDVGVYSKNVAKLAFKGTRYEPILQLFVAHNALVFCDEPKVEQLVKIIKKIPQYILMAAIVEGRLLSMTQLETYMRLKDITTARSHLLAQLNNAASNTVSLLTQHQTILLSRLQQIADAKSGIKEDAS